MSKSGKIGCFGWIGIALVIVLLISYWYIIVSIIAIILIIYMLIKLFKNRNGHANLANIQKNTRSPKSSIDNGKKDNRSKNNLPIIKSVGAIPEDVQKLLWSFDDKVGNYLSPDSGEPSAITASLPIQNDEAEPLGYWPSYSNMTPKQRFTYLNWLTNIDSNVPIGYVFTFFYGLERHIHEGNIDSAIKMIARLKKFHSESSSFNHYSNLAIVYASLKAQNPQLLKYIDGEDTDSVLLFLVNGYFSQKITAKEIIKCAKDIGWDNKRYITMYPDLFETNLKKVLLESIGTEYFPLTNTMQFNDCPTVELMLSNISLNKIETSESDHVVRNNAEINIVFSYISYSPISILVPDFSKAAEVQVPLLNALKQTHELTKQILAKRRKEERYTNTKNNQ